MQKLFLKLHFGIKVVCWGFMVKISILMKFYFTMLFTKVVRALFFEILFCIKRNVFIKFFYSNLSWKRYIISTFLLRQKSEKNRMVAAIITLKVFNVSFENDANFIFYYFKWFKNKTAPFWNWTKKKLIQAF